MMYYLFIKNERDIKKYLYEFNETKKRMEEGKTPVFNEMRSAKTCFFESIPFNLISGIFMVLGAFVISKIQANEIIKIALVMIINSFCFQVANMIFTKIKHQLRINLCERLNIEYCDRNIAVMESLEYQSV